MDELNTSSPLENAVVAHMGDDQGALETNTNCHVDLLPSSSATGNQETISTSLAHYHTPQSMAEFKPSPSSNASYGTSAMHNTNEIKMVNPTTGVMSYTIPVSSSSSSVAPDNGANVPTPHGNRNDEIERARTPPSPTSTTKSTAILSSTAASSSSLPSQGSLTVSSYSISPSPSPPPSPTLVGEGMGSEDYPIQPTNSSTPAGSATFATPVQDSASDAEETESSLSEMQVPPLQHAHVPSEGMDGKGSGAVVQGGSSKRLNEASGRGGPRRKKSKYSGSFDGVIIPEITDDMTPAEKHQIRLMRNRMSAKMSRERENKRELELEQRLYKQRKENPKLLKTFYDMKSVLLEIVKYVEDRHPLAEAKEINKPVLAILTEMDRIYKADPFTFNHPGTYVIPLKYVGISVKPDCEK